MMIYVYNQETMEAIIGIKGKDNEECEAAAMDLIAGNDDLAGTYTPAWGVKGGLTKSKNYEEVGAMDGVVKIVYQDDVVLEYYAVTDEGMDFAPARAKIQELLASGANETDIYAEVDGDYGQVCKHLLLPSQTA